MAEIHKADPAARILSVAILVGGTVAGAAAITLARRFRPELEAWLKKDVVSRSRLVVMGVIVFTAGPILGTSLYLWRLAGRIVRAERYPPPGLRVIRDIPVVAGPAAARWGKMVQLVAVFFAISALLLALSLWHLFSLVVTR